jgi:hypothetical protein
VPTLDDLQKIYNVKQLLRDLFAADPECEVVVDIDGRPRRITGISFGAYFVEQWDGHTLWSEDAAGLYDFYNKQQQEDYEIMAVELIVADV